MRCIIYSPYWLRTVIPLVVIEGELYTYTNVGLSALLVSDEQGKAKALTSGTSDRTGSTFLVFVYMPVRIVINSVVAKSQNLSNYGYCIKASNCSNS